VTPLGSQPAVVEVEPSDHGTNVERTVDGVHDKGSSGHLGTIGDNSAGNNGAEELGALLEAEALKTAAEGVEENPSGRVKLEAPCTG
jgi:hypothetical protein